MLNTNKIKARIVELGINQQDVAKALGIAQPTLSQKINNIRPIDVNEALMLADYLKIEPTEYPAYFFLRQSCETQLN